jgi:hypothetical protein
MLNFPIDTIICICEFLKFHDILALKNVCKKLQNIIVCAKVWKNIKFEFNHSATIIKLFDYLQIKFINFNAVKFFQENALTEFNDQLLFNFIKDRKYLHSSEFNGFYMFAYRELYKHYNINFMPNYDKMNMIVFTCTNFDVLKFAHFNVVDTNDLKFYFYNGSSKVKISMTNFSIAIKINYVHTFQYIETTMLKSFMNFIAKMFNITYEMLILFIIKMYEWINNPYTDFTMFIQNKKYLDILLQTI